MKTAFIGHRHIYSRNIMERLNNAIINEIKSGCRSFTMGTHGEFDYLALNSCRNIRKTYNDLDIEVVITSLNEVKKNDKSGIIPYSDVRTIMYDIDDIYFKRKIIISNQQMLENCDTLICYVNNSIRHSGAKYALNYAEKLGLKIINLYKECDDPFYGMTNEESMEMIEKFIDRREV